jgi:hypothetical protein
LYLQVNKGVYDTNDKKVAYVMPTKITRS